MSFGPLGDATGAGQGASSGAGGGSAGQSSNQLGGVTINTGGPSNSNPLLKYAGPAALLVVVGYLLFKG